jgi:hypothetical protein
LTTLGRERTLKALLAGPLAMRPAIPKELSIMCGKNRLLATAMAFVVLASAARAEYILETASYVGPQSFGYVVGQSQLLGARFSVAETTLVDHVGGNLLQDTPGDLFAAIVSLSDPIGLPSDQWMNDGSVVAHVVFAPPGPDSDDVRIPLSVALAPGHYALVFGSGLFGASGEGVMPFEGQEDTSQASYFAGGDDHGGWVDGGFDSVRFVVTGTSVPEPGTLTLIGTALLGWMTVRGLQGRRRRR